MPSLYAYPDIYADLLEPHLLEWTSLYTWIDRHALKPIQKVMDPACGPATWLKAFADHHFVAGNDASPEMIRFARDFVGDHNAEWTVGSMHCLDFKTKDFDLVLNLNVSIGHLKDDQEVFQHLRALEAHLHPLGLVILSAVILPLDWEDKQRLTLYEGRFQPLSRGGYAKVTYQSLYRLGKARKEGILVKVQTRNLPECPSFDEFYELLTFDPKSLLDLVHRAGFDLVQAYDSRSAQMPSVDFLNSFGDIVLVLVKSPS